MTILRTLVGAAAVLATVVSAPVLAFAQEVTLRVHHFHTTTSAGHKLVVKPWCDKIEQESAGRMKCSIYPLMQLGGSVPQLFDQVRDGVVDIIWMPTGYAAGRFPAMEVLELPFLMKMSPDKYSAAIWDFVEKNQAEQFKDVKLLAFFTNGGIQFYSPKKIETLEDLKGMRLRGFSRVSSNIITTLGASPIAMPVAEVPEALSKGLMDGLLTTWEGAQALKLEEMVKYIAEPDPQFGNLTAIPQLFAMNKAKYESLPPDLKAVIDANSGHDASKWAGYQYETSSPPARQAMKDGGVTTRVIPAAELPGWEKTLEPVFTQWVDEANKNGLDGAALVEAAKAAVKANE